MTFEPDESSWLCLRRNVPPAVEVFPFAVGAFANHCDIAHRGLGSASVIEGDKVRVVAVDDFTIEQVDLIQFDVEGYEMQALEGSARTIARWHPLIQVELRETHLQKYGSSVKEVRQFLSDRGYMQVSSQQGSDFVFEARP